MPRGAHVVGAHRPAADPRTIPLAGRTGVAPWLRPRGVVEGAVLTHARPQLPPRGLALPGPVLVRDAAPPPLHNEVVERPSASVPAAGHPRALPYPRDRRAGAW